MKLNVACLLVLATFTWEALGQRQSVPPSQKTSSALRPQTIRICQGLPIPDGYVIVAYMTSTTCPHGAYILKKQDQFESSLAVSRKASATDDPGSGPKASGNRSPSGRNSPSAKSARDRKPLPAIRTNEAAQASNGPQPAKVTAPTGNVPSASRPRRVTAESSQDAIGPPTLIGSEPAGAMTPPKLTKMDGSSELPSTATPVPVADPTPEEVGENDIVRVDTMLVTVPVSVS